VISTTVLKSEEDHITIQGDVGGDIFAGVSNNDTINAPLIDSTIKTMLVNTYQAITDVIKIFTKQDLNPLDGVNQDGVVYLAVSKKEADSGYYYTCVAESTLTPSFNTANQDSSNCPPVVRAMVVFDGITDSSTGYSTVIQSYNVESVQHLGVGYYQINFKNPIHTEYFAASGMGSGCYNGIALGFESYGGGDGTKDNTIEHCVIRAHGNGSASSFDSNYITIIVVA